MKYKQQGNLSAEYRPSEEPFICCIFTKTNNTHNMEATYSRGLDKFTEQDNSSKEATGCGVHSYIALHKGSFISLEASQITSIDKEVYLASFTIWEGGNNDYVDFLEWLSDILD